MMPMLIQSGQVKGFLQKLNGKKPAGGSDGQVYSWGNLWNDNYSNNSLLNLSYLTGFMPDFI